MAVVDGPTEEITIKQIAGHISRCVDYNFVAVLELCTWIGEIFYVIFESLESNPTLF